MIEAHPFSICVCATVKDEPILFSAFSLANSFKARIVALPFSFNSINASVNCSIEISPSPSAVLNSPMFSDEYPSISAT